MDAPQTRPQRRLPLEGAVNFRDLGGYPVSGGRRTRWNRLFRSDSLAALTDRDLAIVSALGLHTVVDFRVPGERSAHPNRLPVRNAPRTVELGFWPDGVSEMLRALRELRIDAAGIEKEVTRHYRLYATEHCAEYRAMLEVIEQADGRPVLIHCVSGKDRTGFGAAILLLAIGASRSVVVEDYLLTNHYRRDIGHLMPPGTSADVADVFTAAKTCYIDAAFDAIESAYGDVDTYFEQGLGFDAQRRRRLSDRLTESAS